MWRSLPSVYARLLTATLVFFGTVLAGTFAYYTLGEGRWSMFDCLYMTIITLSTVGYGEVLPGMNKLDGVRVINLALIVLGSGTLVYFVSNLTALIVEGDLGGILRLRRMERAIDRLTNHVIVCGVGSTGRHVATELDIAGTPYVLVDRDEHRLLELKAELGDKATFIVGEATEDHVLERAGIARARGVIAALTDDKDNVFITITARSFNANARIVAKCVEPSTEAKLRRAGANSVVSPNYIGGMRMASEMIRPATVQFLDRMLRDRGGNSLRIEEIGVPDGSNLIGKRLADTQIRNLGVLVIALHLPDGEYLYNPSGDHEIKRGSALIVLAEVPDVAKVRKALDDDALV
jgi:voltage-gated potassium channel